MNYVYLIILLAGNSIKIQIPKEEQDTVIEFMKQCIARGIADPGFLFSYKKYHILTQHVVAVYIEE